MQLIETDSSRMIVPLHTRQLQDMGRVFTEFEVEQKWLDYPETHFILAVAEEDMAFLAWKRKENHIYISDLFVAPEYRHQGYATQLLKALKKKGQVIELLVSRENVAARHLYTREGFIEVTSKSQENIRMVFTGACTE